MPHGSFFVRISNKGEEPVEKIGKLFSGGRAAIFDVDGTLIDSMPMWHEIDAVYAAQKGFVLTPQMTRELDTQHLADCARYFREKCGVQESEEEIVREIVALAAKGYAEDVPEVPGARALLAGMKRRGMHAERFGARPEECVVFEDARYALRTARAAGFRTVAVLGSEEDLKEREALRALADLAVEDLRDLARKISEMKG